MASFCRQRAPVFYKVVSLFVLMTFGLSIVASPTGAAAGGLGTPSGITPSVVQGLPNLPAVGQSIWLTPVFQPPVLRGMTVHPENPLLFDFIVDRGQDKINNDLLKVESTKLIKYFLASMTIPDKDAWVNLSPYEKDRIIPDALGQTEMGRQMLEQDYILKQLASSLTNPDKELGQKFWNEVKARAQKQFGTTDIPLSTFNKVWIVPDGATVVEKDGFAYITESKLTVMLDEDYNLSSQGSSKGTVPALQVSSKGSVPALQGSSKGSVPALQGSSKGSVPALQGTVPREIGIDPSSSDFSRDVSKLSTAVFREMILPKLVEEVNTGKNFAQTRQVYQSVILATWYKKALKDSLLGRIYADKSKVKGIESDVKDIKQKVYDQYLQAFKKGAYNVIKEESNGTDDPIPRKYFSGGEVMNMATSSLTILDDLGHVQAVRAINQLPVDQVALVSSSATESISEKQTQLEMASSRLQERIASLSPRLQAPSRLRVIDFNVINEAGMAGSIFSNPELLDQGIIYKVETEDHQNGDIGRYRLYTNEATVVQHLNEASVEGVPELLEYGNISWSSRLTIKGYQFFEKFSQPLPSLRKLLIPKDLLEGLFRRTTNKSPLRFMNSSQFGKIWGNFKQYLQRTVSTSPYMKLQGIPNAKSLKDSEIWESYTLRERLIAFISLAGTLDQIHVAGVIHNDIKTANILINGDAAAGNPLMVIDFSHSLLMGEEDDFAKWLPINRRHKNSVQGDIQDFGQMMWEEISESAEKEGVPLNLDLWELFYEMVYPDAVSPGSMSEVKSKLQKILADSDQQVPVSETKTKMDAAYAKTFSFYSRGKTKYDTKFDDVFLILQAEQRARTPRNGIEVRLESDWIYRGQFDEEAVDRASLYVNVTPQLVDELDQLIISGVMKGYYKFGELQASTNPIYRHDAVNLYFAEPPSNDAIKSLKVITAKYLRDSGHLLGRKISDGFYLSEVGSIKDRHAQDLVEQIKKIDRFLGLAYQHFLTTTYIDGIKIDRISMSEGQYFGVKEGLNLIGWDIVYDREKGFTLNNLSVTQSQSSTSSGIVESTSVGSSGVDLIPVGGIDFDPSKLNLQIKRDGHGVPLPLPQQNLENIDIKGLYPSSLISCLSMPRLCRFSGKSKLLLV